MWCAALQCV